MAVQEAMPDLVFERDSGEGVPGEAGQNHIRVEGAVHLVLPASRIWLQVLHDLVDLRPVAAIVRSRELSARDRHQALRVHFLRHLACIAEGVGEGCVHEQPVVDPRRRIPALLRLLPGHRHDLFPAPIARVPLGIQPVEGAVPAPQPLPELRQRRLAPAQVEGVFVAGDRRLICDVVGEGAVLEDRRNPAAERRRHRLAELIGMDARDSLQPLRVSGLPVGIFALQIGEAPIPVDAEPRGMHRDRKREMVLGI